MNETEKVFVSDFLVPLGTPPCEYDAITTYNYIFEFSLAEPWDRIKEYIKQMEYSDFLKTYYWYCVRDYKKFLQNGRCQLCGNFSQTTQAHHAKYTIRGMEHFALNFITILCSDCHSKYHGKTNG